MLCHTTIDVTSLAAALAYRVMFCCAASFPKARLRYEDGLYVFERFSRGGAVTSVRDKRILTRALRALHRPWFVVWMPTGVAALTTTGRKSGRPRATFVRAYRGADRGLPHSDYLRARPVAQADLRKPRSDTALSAK